MGIEAIFLVLALCSVFITRGSYRQLLATQLNHAWTLGIVLLGFLAIEFAPIGSDQYDSIGFVLLLATYVFLFGFCVANISLKGMWVVMLGLGSNALVIGLNRGMPVTSSGGYVAKESIKYQPESPHDIFPFLSDIFPINALSMAVSIGDIIFGVGLVAVFYFASRRPRKNEVEIFVDLTQQETIILDDKATNESDLPAMQHTSIPQAMPSSSHRPKVRKSDAKRQAKLEKLAQRRAHKKWQKSHGLAALPSKESLGFDEQSMEIVDAAN